MVLVWVFAISFALAVLFIRWDVWRKHRQDRKRLLDDYDKRPYRGNSPSRVVRRPTRSSNYGQYDGSYVPHISTFDSHSHGGDYSSDSCDSGGGGCDGGGGGD